MAPHGLPDVAPSSTVALQLDAADHVDARDAVEQPLSHRLLSEPRAERPRSPDAAHARQHAADEEFTSSLRQHTARIRTLKVRADFEYTLLIVLSVHVVYMHYLDFSLLVFLIRASQLVRLLYFPCDNPHSQRGTALLLLFSNLPILAIHRMLFMGSFQLNAQNMIFINFIGPEPTGLFKTLYVDIVTIVLQLLLLQCKWHACTFPLLTALPVPASEPLVPISRDAQLEQHQDAQPTNSPPLT